MNTVGKLGSYISRSVYTVSGPFHPFGGAVDIVVVEQKDGSFKSSPWYVRFGKFQGVLKAKEKVVSINVNGVEAGFHMYLDHKGEAHFLREADVEEGDTLLSPSSSGEDTDGQSSKRMPVKSKSCNCAAYESDSVTEIGISNLRVASRTNSRRSRIMGLVFGRKSVKQVLPEQDNEAGYIRTDSLDRAELAADLLEVKWSTNLVSPRRGKDTTSLLSSQDTSEVNACEEIQITDEQDNVGCLINDTLVDNLNNCVPMEKIGSTNDEKDHSSHAFPMRPERSDEETGIEMSCLVPESLLGKSRVPDDGKTNLENQSKTGSLLDDDADGGAISIDIIPKVASAECGIQDSLNLEFSLAHESTKGLFSNENREGSPDSSLSIDESEAKVASAECGIQNSLNLEFSPAHESTKGLFSNEDREGSPDSSLSMDESEAKSVPLFLSSETSVCSRFDLDAEQANGTTCVSSGKCEESFLATVQTIDLVCEVNSNSGTSLDEKEPSRIDNVLEKNDYFISSDNGKSPESPGISSDSMQKDVISQTYSPKVSLQPSYGSVEVEPRSIVTVSTFSNSICQPLVDKSMIKENDFESPVEHSQISKIDHPVSPNDLLTEISEEEQLFFGDLDDLKGIDQGDAEDSIIHTCSSSADKSGCENLPDDAGALRRTLKTISSEVNIPVTGRSQSEEVPRIVKSLPNMWSHDSGFYVHYNDHKLPKGPNETEDVKSIEQLKTGVNPIVGDSSIPFDASNRSWRIWSFPFKKSQSINISQSSLNGNSSDSEIIGNKEDAIEDEKAMPKTKATKKKIRVTTPTSQQVASLNLKEGRNTVVFTFSTPMLGKQQVDARIYLWKWDTRIVISDVDGTITRSDLLGQVMPLVGVDWSQTGVAHLFSAIKENGYQFLFLSARAISQAYHTRQFLFNLKQDGKALPDAPVVISPDGLFPSLYREVVRRAPHEFKISCLEDIKALFPPDRNPFYAGFGNRDTDEFSYLKVGIPKGKIFIINPKGQVVVNHRLDTKSYTSFHALVNDMFPSRTSFEQEDYNSWNFWKLPPPDIDI